MIQHIAFRTDATLQIGTGHFMRCLTLAENLKKRGAQIRFISRDLPVHLQTMLQTKAIEVVALAKNINDVITDDLAHSHWLGCSQADDAQATLQALADKNWDWLVVDHYALDARWERKLREKVKKILVIDDLADREHDCDVLLDQNYYADMETRYLGKVPTQCQLLLGAGYGLLRDEFLQKRAQIKPRSGAVKRILVFFGGVDADNYTGLAIAALAAIAFSEIQIDVVIGAGHPYREQIKSSCAERGFNCHIQTDKMAQLMAEADLAIGAGGSATWERCCLGLPTLAICTADNQQKQLADTALVGWLYSPKIKKELKQLQTHIAALIENNYLREFISRNCMQAIDGQGILRVISSLENNHIEMRRARLEDSENIFQWRNHARIRAVSNHTGLIAWSEHQKWFSSTLSDSKKALLIGWIKESPVGVVRFDVQNNEAEISIYLVPDGSFAGQGKNLLKSAERWFAANFPAVSQINANVLGDNIPSHKLFKALGYQIDSTCYKKELKHD